MARRIDQKEFEKRIRTRFPEENFQIKEYTVLRNPAKIKCLKCSKIIEVSSAGNFLAKNKVYGCKNCYGLWRKREEKINLIKNKYDIISTEVKNTHTYYTIKCKECGHRRVTTLNNIIKNLECGCKTNVYRKRTPEEFIKEVNKYALEGSFELIGEYKNQTTKVLIKHSCGFIWKVRPADIIHGRIFCPKCSSYESKGVKYIKKILKENNIHYEQERKMDNSLQRFDFYLEINANKIAIEYNGMQHYKEVKYFHISLKEQQERDEKKKVYCKKNNINLLIIPYTLTNSEIRDSILKYINKFND